MVSHARRQRWGGGCWSVGRWLSFLASLSAAPGSAQPHPSGRAGEHLSATIVRVDGPDIYVDVGRAMVTPGATLTVFRRIEVRHPITGRRLADRFAIGRVRIADTGERLSLAHVDGDPRHPLNAGDVVEGVRPANLANAPRATPRHAPTSTNGTPVPAAQAEPPARAAADPEVAELLRYFYAGLGQPLERRQALYEGYLARHASSRFAQRVREEVFHLRALRAQTANASSRSTDAVATGPRALVLFDPVTRFAAGVPLELAAAYDAAADVRGVVLHVRKPGAPGYASQALRLDGRGQARGLLAATLMQAPTLEYFIEAVDAAGQAHAAVGAADEPLSMRVEDPAPTPSRGDAPVARVRYAAELVSFDGTSGRDYYLSNEGDFMYRVRLPPLHAVRIGYGHYRGMGGTVDYLDVERRDPLPAGFSYGFAQTDLGLSELFGISLRATVGLGRPEQETSQRDGITGGFQLRARIGRMEGTRLELAGELMPEIGQRAFLALHWEVIERFPMGTEVHVTDQPVNSDELAVRLVYEAGYRLSERFLLSLRPSYQLRTIRHAGPGLGLATTFDW